MAILDRLVDGAIVLKIEGRSYRAHGARRLTPPPSDDIRKAKRLAKVSG